MSNTLDIDVEQHATFTMTLQLKDGSGSAIDITDLEFSGSVKQKFADTTPIAVFAFEKTLPVSGVVAAYLTSEETGKLVRTQYYYDIVSIDYDTTPIQVTRLLQGVCNVDLGVTDPPVTDD